MSGIYYPGMVPTSGASCMQIEQVIFKTVIAVNSGNTQNNVLHPCRAMSIVVLKVGKAGEIFQG